jgi:hypothetical protein
VFSRIDRRKAGEMIQIDVEGLGKTVRELKKFEPELFAQMKKEIINEPGVASVLSSIKSKVPYISPLLGNSLTGKGGMLHNGRTRYETPKVRIYVRNNPRLSKSGGQRSLIGFEAVSPGDAAGFEILDLVGSGPDANSRNAKGMLKKLRGEPSRYVWKGYEARREGVTRAVLAIVNRYTTKANVKLEVI